jgi:hypothetical protein
VGTLLDGVAGAAAGSVSAAVLGAEPEPGTLVVAAATLLATESSTVRGAAELDEVGAVESPPPMVAMPAVATATSTAAAIAGLCHPFEPPGVGSATGVAPDDGRWLSAASAASAPDRRRSTLIGAAESVIAGSARPGFGLWSWRSGIADSGGFGVDGSSVHRRAPPCG